jgi:hypothetical protein
LDRQSGVLSGEPEPLADRILGLRGPIYRPFSAANDGTLAYWSAPLTPSELLWFDRTGRPDREGRSRQRTLRQPGVTQWRDAAGHAARQRKHQQPVAVRSVERRGLAPDVSVAAWAAALHATETGRHLRVSYREPNHLLDSLLSRTGDAPLLARAEALRVTLDEKGWVLVE